MKRLLFLIVLVLLIFLGLNFFKISKKLSPVPKHTNLQGNIISNDFRVNSYQINKNGDKVIFLAINDGYQDLYSWNALDSSLIKLNLENLPYDGNLNNPEKFAKTFIDKDGNIFFESGGYIIRVSTNNKIQHYKYLANYLLYNEDELNNKTMSKIYKKIIDKYSVEQISGLKMYDSPNITAFLIELDENYYIQSTSDTLTLDRLPFGDENVNTVTKDEFLDIRYGARWDSKLNKLNPQAVIDRITETVRISPKIIDKGETYSYVLPSLLEDDKAYTIMNSTNFGKILSFCYPNFFNVDGPTCKGKRLFLQISTKEFMVPNYDKGSEYSSYDSQFLYIPYDKRFFTSDGSFIFLSQHNILYRFK